MSKVWHLIERFSEDIDLAVDRSLFGFEGDLTKKQIKKLRKASSLFVKDTFCPALQEAVEKYGLQDFCKSSLSQTVRAIAHIQNRERFS